MGLILLLTLAHVALPFTAPFAAAGTHVHTSLPLNEHLPTLRPNNSAQGQSSHTARYLATATVTEPSGNDSRSIRGFFSRLFTGTTPESGKKGEHTSSLISRLLFGYASPLLKTASSRQLVEEDSLDLCRSQRMDLAVTGLSRTYDLLRSNNRKQLDEAKEKSIDEVVGAQSLLLTRALLLSQRRTLLYTGILRLFNTAVQAFPAILVARLLRLVEAGESQPASRALTAAFSLVAVLSTKMLIENQYFHTVVKCSSQVRGSLAGMIFDKSLRLQGGGSNVIRRDGKGKSGNESLGGGGVMNLMQSDAGIIESAAMQFHTLWDGPLQIAMYTTLLFQYLGRSVIWGIAVLLVTVPVNSVALRVLNRLAKYENEARDQRTKRTAESINNMKLLKLQGWENQFADDIRFSRREELRRVVERGVIRALNSAFSNAVPALVLVVTLTAYARTGKPLVASTIFTAISLFNQLRFPLFFYPMLVDALANGRNAMRRIAGYLSAEEIPEYVEHLPSTEGGSIEMTNGNFMWSVIGDGLKPADPALVDVNLRVNPGEVVAVVGTVGSGKSALVKSLLGELNPVSRDVVDESLLSGASHSASHTETGEASLYTHPSVTTHGNIAYCSQEAWLPKGTLRDAIVFGREYDETRFLAALYDAGLDADIATGSLSPSTDVGEGGSSLSGGQRARVALARALYSESDTAVFLLDDCLAALDANVGSLVFERMTKRLRSTKAATILVTNDPSIPRRCDRVVLVSNVPGSNSCSTVVDEGTYDELLARGHNLRSISASDAALTESDRNVKTVSSTSRHGEPTVLTHTSSPQQHGDIRVVRNGRISSNDTEVLCHADPECQMGMENCPDFLANEAESVGLKSGDPEVIMEVMPAMDHPLTTGTSLPLSSEHDNAESSGGETGGAEMVQKLTSADDNMSAGAVPISTYVSYFKSVGSPLLVAAMLLSYLTVNGAQFFQQYTVAKWTEVSGSAASSALGLSYLRSLVNAAGVVSVVLWLRSYFTMRVGIKASEVMHSKMLSAVFAAPMSFFDSTPSGQLLTRFGKEIETVDKGVPDSIGSVLFCFLQIFTSIGAMAGVITPAMLGPLALVSVFYVKVMALFRPAARDMKRVETKTRSPIFTHFGEAQRGAEIIRSVPGARSQWSGTHRSLSDRNLSVFSTVKAFDRWLSTRLETLGNTVVFTAAVASVFLTRTGRLKAGSAGWGLTQALAITGLLTWAVRCLTDLETNMMSVVRVQELSDVESEEVDMKDLDKAGGTRPQGSYPNGTDLDPKQRLQAIRRSPMDSGALVESGWPWCGNVRFNNVSMRYNSATPLVLNGITLSIPAGTTLGVVGRTGSGKSTLLVALWRLVEIEGGGSIEIDGVDIRSVALADLRNSLAIIPQDPVLFAGTISYNLDATGRASPEDMWAALEAASPSLANQFRRADGLDTRINEGGGNLSQGERQLICLARALVRKCRVLAMDEATASVDSNTDQEVQETIRREFVQKGVTVVTIAHRLDTVLGYDKIAVLGDGKILEYGTAAELLRIPGGELRQLVEADRQNKQKGSQEYKALTTA